MEKSVFIIKPDAMKRSRKVKNVLLRAGLKIVSSKKIRLTPKMIDRFYDNLRHKRSIRQATMDYLLNKTVEIGVVEGKSAILRLVAVCGQWTNPKKCEPNTIRALLGGKQGKRINRSYTFWRNAIHRSRNKSEAKRDLKIFYTI
ncbi:MAG: nucleoside-diphosphate kinase [Patescibacteria group bacterium]